MTRVTGPLLYLPEYESPEHDDNLRYLNAHWAIDPTPDGPGSGVEWKDKAKRRLAATVMSTLPGTSRATTRISRARRPHHPARALACLPNGRGTHASAAIGDESRRLADRQDVLHARLEHRIATLEARIAELEGRQEETRSR